ncbi:hypothetical protein ACFU5O_28250 [Streptomyces sp. NPDC057445]|uniref:hypothetical protein n=1 Tax=Streptomyces sp. NPDC057445 TaxID=3346136 RepID=UPI0036BBCD35
MTTTTDLYDPVPGTEYIYVLSDYARAAARALGSGWGAESGFLGAWGLIFRTEEPALASTHGRSLRLYVDAEGDLCVEIHDDVMPSTERHWIRTVDLPDCAPRTPEALAEWGEAIATVIRRHYLA